MVGSGDGDGKAAEVGGAMGRASAPGWGIEVVRRPPAGKRYLHALFDFDGTVSLLREGWQDVMVPYFMEVLAPYCKDGGHGEGRSALSARVREFVDLLTGKQTIFQCMRLDEEVRSLGGPPADPYGYKAEYLRRLMARIGGRHAAIREGRSDPGDHLVPGAVDFLRILRGKEARLYLASGTDEADVVAEARLLGIEGLFGGRVHGARDSQKECSKEAVIRDLLKDNAIRGEDLISFGDGYVEVQLVKEVGGYAVAVATDESGRAGVDEWKRRRLLSAGADAVVPDFSEAEALAAFLGY